MHGIRQQPGWVRHHLGPQESPRGLEPGLSVELLQAHCPDLTPSTTAEAHLEQDGLHSLADSSQGHREVEHHVEQLVLAGIVVGHLHSTA